MESISEHYFSDSQLDVSHIPKSLRLALSHQSTFFYILALACSIHGLCQGINCTSKDFLSTMAYLLPLLQAWCCVNKPALYILAAPPELPGTSLLLLSFAQPVRSGRVNGHVLASLSMYHFLS
ncbi:hypothetical protein CHARACLAT_021883 [Characodon lateralis]|uniref:Uncharacterized protein n=1 Tax=Characodon lateralis TaxID=208331 RepID=A0ABU7EL92_9TELE|nr:hypothetical protein [Characodon lateralis]